MAEGVQGAGSCSQHYQLEQRTASSCVARQQVLSYTADVLQACSQHYQLEQRTASSCVARQQVLSHTADVLQA